MNMIQYVQCVHHFRRKFTKPWLVGDHLFPMFPSVSNPASEYIGIHRNTSEYMGYRPAGAGEDRGLSETLGEGDG